jgi:hypothetical protein
MAWAFLAAVFLLSVLSFMSVRHKRMPLQSGLSRNFGRDFFCVLDRLISVKYKKSFLFTNGHKQLQPKVNGKKPTNFFQLPQLCLVGNQQQLDDKQ